MSRLASLLPIVVAASHLGCASASAGSPAPAVPSTPQAAAPTANAPGATPAPPREPGERPLVTCGAKHAIAKLPYAAVDVDAWAKALAGYKPQANGGRPVAWEGAEGDMKAYLEAVHACTHVAFAESFLPSLASLPKEHPLSDPELATTVELVVDGESGALVESDVVASSGVPELDAAVLAAFARAFPLEPPPPATLSSDGRFYVTWEVHRRREQACSAAGARAWKLRF